MSRKSVLIVGAGPTGLVLALWLTKSGVSVRIIDKTLEAGTTSRALAVQGRTLEFYRQLGIANAVVDAGVQVAAANLWVAGRRAARVRLADIGKGASAFPFMLVYPQDAHEMLLVQTLAELGVQVERRTELTGFEQHRDGVSARLVLPDGTEDHCDAEYVAGCDGAHSKVREVLGIGFPGGIYEHMFYVADAEVNGPVADHELHVDLDTSDFVAVFPLKGDHRVRLIGSVVVPLGRDQRALTFADVSSQAISQMKIEVEKVNWFSTYRVHHRVALSFRGKRAFLLGDAAHIHSPVGGQGMNTGIGDAVNLGWKLAAVLNGEADDRLLGSYEPERIAFARRLVESTDRAFTIATSHSPLAALVRRHIAPVIVPRLFASAYVRRFLYRTVSQIGISYPDSALSVGRAGKIRSGDRLPWVPSENGDDNFTPLASMHWQAHVYGEVRVSASAACGELQLPLHVFPWTSAATHAGLERSALYLVRPDGYVALADGSGGALGLRGYFRSRGLMPMASE